MEECREVEFEPGWFSGYTGRLKKENKDLLEEIKELSGMPLGQVEMRIGGSLDDLPYQTLQTLFIDGSDDQKVAGILRSKRSQYLLVHPEEQKSRGASKGIITFDGRFIPKGVWQTATDSEKRGALVGSTCFHYNSDTPNMDSSPTDRF